MTVGQRRGLFWGLLLAALLAALAFAFWPQPVLVDLAEIGRGRLAVTVDEEGETRVRDVFVLGAPVAGRARRIEAEAGDLVKAGLTVLAQIEPIDPAFLDVRSQAEAEAAVKAAEAALALAKAELEKAQAEYEFTLTEIERARTLITKQTISEAYLDKVEMAYATGRATVETAKATLQMRSFELDQARAQLVSPVETQALHGTCECVPITAPVSGQVLRVLHESAGVVAAGEPLVEIGDPGDLEIVSDLLSADAVTVEPGQSVVIEEWGGPEPLNGRVRRVEPYGFTKVSALGIEEQRVNVIIDLTDPPARWSRLGHGYRVEVRILLWEGEDVLKLPTSALFRVGDRWAVFADVDGRARQRLVEVGRQNGLEAEIIDGLAAGERVVLQPSDRVFEGVRIQARH